MLGAALMSSAVYAQAPAARRIESYLQMLDSAGQLSGTVLVARGNEIILERSYGRRAYTGANDNTPATLFAIASVTKPITGIATRLLAERGVISLEEPIARWVPDFPNASRITIAHLLGHRAGIPHRVTTLSDEQQPQSPETMARLIGRASFVSQPGAQRLYSSAGYTLLAHVLERATGKAYATLVRELVLQPADAVTAFDATERLDMHTRAEGHFWTPEGPLAAPKKDLSFLAGAGSLWATPRDLFKVVRRIVEGDFGRAAIAGALAPNGAIQWTGFTNGFQAIVSYDPATNVAIVVTANVLTGAAEAIVRDAPRLLAGESVSAPNVPRVVPFSLNQDRRRELEGVYNFGGNEQQLTFVRPSVAILGGEYAIVAINDSSFFAAQNYAEVRVRRSAEGNVTSLDFVGAAAFAMPRVR